MCGHGVSKKDFFCLINQEISSVTQYYLTKLSLLFLLHVCLCSVSLLLTWFLSYSNLIFSLPYSLTQYSFVRCQSRVDDIAGKVHFPEEWFEEFVMSTNNNNNNNNNKNNDNEGGENKTENILDRLHPDIPHVFVVNVQVS
jgi:hypothetical protein